MLKHIKYFTLLPCLALLGSNTALAQTTKKERWYEVEVILFQQLGDKKLLKEQFPEDMQSAALSLQNKRHIELLTPFLKPNTSALKLQLPICGEKTEQRTFFQQAATPTPFYQSKTLANIEQLTFEQAVTDADDKFIEDGSDITSDEFSSDINNDSMISADPEQSFNQDIEHNQSNNENTVSDNTDILPSALLSSALSNSTNASNDFVDPEFFEPLTPETIALVNQAAQEFAAFKFELSADYLPAKPKSRKQHPQLCRLPAHVLAQLSNEDASFNANDFPLDKVPSTINAAEDVYSHKPYLLAKSSLKLNDIVKQLRWSKAFKPLLHVGWRLAPKGRNYAIPLHIFAGDNLKTAYKKQLAQYNKAINAALAQEQRVQAQQSLSSMRNSDNQLNAINSNETASLNTNKKQQTQQAVYNRLNNILTQLNSVKLTNNELPSSQHNVQLDLNKLIADLDDDKLALKLNDKITELEQKYHLKKPQPPLQDWFLDGWFKVHLNHYLYITANMTMLNKTLAEQASDEIKFTQNPTFSGVDNLKLIEFKQDRRVISKEIHYLDNPYLGIIVQIRRHKRPAPPVDEDEETKPISVDEITTH